MLYIVNLYESKFSKVKSNCGFNNNKINVSSSIARASEYVRSVEFLEKKYRRDVYEVSRYIQLEISDLDSGAELAGNFIFFRIPIRVAFLALLAVPENTNVCASKLVTFRGMDYEVGSFLVIDFDKHFRFPVFVKIEKFIFIEEKWIAFVQKTNTTRFCDLLQAFVIDPSNDYALVDLETIYDYHPLDSHKFAGHEYVFMAHQIF